MEIKTIIPRELNYYYAVNLSIRIAQIGLPGSFNL